MKFLDDIHPSGNYPTRVKICGMTSAEDARNAAGVGADAVGLIFYAPSSRNLSCEQAAAIREALPESTAAVAVVVDPEDALLEQIVERVRPDYLQFHGSESPGRCVQHGIPYIKAVRVRNAAQIDQAIADHRDAKAFLLDAYDEDHVGGTGKKFAWDLIPEAGVPIILAGGLNHDNVGRAVGQVRPFAVDVSTGVEDRGGRKSRDLMARFMSAVAQADASLENVAASG